MEKEERVEDERMKRAWGKVCPGRGSNNSKQVYV